MSVVRKSSTRAGCVGAASARALRDVCRDQREDLGLVSGERSDAVGKSLWVGLPPAGGGGQLVVRAQVQLVDYLVDHAFEEVFSTVDVAVRHCLDPEFFAQGGFHGASQRSSIMEVLLSPIRRVIPEGVGPGWGPSRRPQSAKRQRFVELRAAVGASWPQPVRPGCPAHPGRTGHAGDKTYRNGREVGFVPPTDRDRLGGYLTQLIASVAMFGLFLFLTYYLEETLGHGPILNGLAYLPMIAVTMLCATLLNGPLIR